MAFDDTSHTRKPDACSFEFFRAMQPLEHAEQLVHIAHVEADAVVAHEDVLLAFGDADADFDHRVRPRTRVLHGVVDQVGEHPLQADRVALDQRRLGAVDLDVGAQRGGVVDDALDE